MSAILERLSEELRPPLSAAEAVIEADRCLDCRGGEAPAPCMVACPADVDVASFVASLADDDPAAAATTIFQANLLGGTCARVCPVEVLCQAGCVLSHDGQPPIEIAALQRYATEWAFANELPLRPTASANGLSAAVVGAGPAGLAAAGELASRGYAVTLYDEREEPGGLVRYAIAPYRQTNEPLPAEAAALARLGVEFRHGVRVDRARLDVMIDEHDAVVIAVGMGRDVQLHYPGEELEGVWDSLDFIERLKTGRAPSVGERVAVVGGGNTAVDVAVEAKRLGATVALLLYRRTEAEMPAYPHEVELARREGVAIHFLVNPVEFVGTSHVEGVRCALMELGAPDDTGRRRPQPVPGTDFVIPVDTIVKAVGQEPRQEFADLLGAVDANGRTSNPKVFAAGDAVNGGASVVEAVREAKLAVQSIEELRCPS
ncbi:MAG TPA: FAD-dependent oxidoreductase [Gaiellaceae bacterium]|nr:FAD-dependent oxidoreductase [Gaiellaceae bacterium]